MKVEVTPEDLLAQTLKPKLALAIQELEAAEARYSEVVKETRKSCKHHIQAVADWESAIQTGCRLCLQCGLEGKNQFTDKNWAILVKAKTTRIHMVSHSDLYSLRIPE